MSRESQPIRVLIADPHLLSCQNIRTGLKPPSIQVVAEVSDGPALLRLTRRLAPHILLVDIALAKYSGLEQALRDYTSTRLVVMLPTPERADIIDALRAGARGMVLKTGSPSELLYCIHSVHCGKYAIGSEAIEVMVKALRDASPNGNNGVSQGKFALTNREIEIIGRITAGLSNRQVCEEFSISERTVKHHLTRIYNKIGVTNRLALALFAINNRLISTPVAMLNQQLQPNRLPNGFSSGAAE